MGDVDLVTSAPDVEVLSMEVPCNAPFADTADSHFRMRIGKQVKYIIIEPGIFSVDVLSFPPDLLAQLPPLPAGDWVQARVERGVDGNPTVLLEHMALARVHTQWHQNRMDVLSLPRGKYVKGNNVRVLQYDSRLVIAKIAAFEWDIPRREREIAVYQAIDGCGLGPTFLGHLVEGDRVIGFLLELLQGRPAGPEDLQGCLGAVQRLHALDIVHGDPNRYNFIVSSDGTVTLIDFENAMPCASTEEKDQELATLPAQLSEETGRGRGVSEAFLED
ncbi:hypothetical protein K503DRAFT_870718 [Rhizopogon vinicolor AM-OR11-026]|uniref:Alpha-galactosidase A n=1 Tax=Rhizopogon vinicolor AM-OR11-026 TaxID=1314800 RepID=A0A1B7MF33_9AGAM|nr:hypothetical protein K503DRAFT_870718 [Rhizopogon vinicolor AM-OR11-026]